jgi:hypothetical protein
MDRLAAIEAPLDTTVTTVYPGLRTGEFLTAVVLPTPVVPWAPEAGGIEVEDLAHHTSLYQPVEVYCGFSGGPDREARVVAHETGHAEGLVHLGGERLVMDPSARGTEFTGGEVATANAAIDDFEAGFRFGVYVDSDAGATVYRQGRFQLFDNAHPERGGFPAA